MTQHQAPGALSALQTFERNQRSVSERSDQRDLNLWQDVMEPAPFPCCVRIRIAIPYKPKPSSVKLTIPLPCCTSVILCCLWLLCVHWFLSPGRKRIQASIFFFFPHYRWIMIRIPIPQSRDILGKSIFASPAIGKNPSSSHLPYISILFNIWVCFTFVHALNYYLEPTLQIANCLHWLQSCAISKCFHCQRQFTMTWLFYPPVHS